MTTVFGRVTCLALSLCSIASLMLREATAATPSGIPAASGKRELTKVTINRIDFPNAKPYHDLIFQNDLPAMPKTYVPDCIIEIAEYLPEKPRKEDRQGSNFDRKAGHNFVLHAAGHPDIHLKLNGLDAYNNNRQGFGAYFADEDRKKMVSGVNYTIEPINTSPRYRWTVGKGVFARKP